MEWSTAQLFLAYRHAKHALYQEHRGMDRLAYAVAERRLPELIRSLQHRLRRRPGWFTGMSPGRAWLLPKKATMANDEAGVASIGEDRPSTVKQLTVRVHVTPSVEFAIVEILWLWTFGPALEAILRPAALGNRLKLRWDDGRVDVNGRGPFKFWPTEYKRFRDEGFAVARRMLAGEGRCLLATFDIAGYYDNLDPQFLVQGDFLSEVEARATQRGIPFDRAEFVRATKSLLKAIALYHRDCRDLTGIAIDRGIPIGCLSSRLIANVALAGLDDHIATQPEVRYYARYVDDILLVTDPGPPTPRSARRIAERYLPVLGRAPKSRDMFLDTARLRRRGSTFRLQEAKLKGYLLRGRQGRDFLSTIERDVRQISSERRAFLHPDGLGSASPISSLLVGSDQNSPVQLLREIDRLKVGRYAASVAVSKVGVGVRLLDFPDTSGWCRDQLLPLAGVLTDAAHWIELIDLGFRALGVCIQARDAQTARLIITRHRRQWKRFVTSQRRTPLLWNGRRIKVESARGALLDWFEARRAQEICAAIPLELLRSGSATQRFLREISKGPLDVAGRELGPHEVRRRALVLARADLRSLDRESDRSAQALEDGTADRPKSWQRLERDLRSDPVTSERLMRVDSFQETCAQLGDQAYQGLAATSMLLLTRPPSAFDVAWRWAEAGRPIASLIPTLNAIRGTRYDDGAIRLTDDHTVDITPLGFWEDQSPKELLMVLGNLQASKEGPWSAALGQSDLSRARLTSLGRIVNLAIERRVRTGKSTVLLLPELALPRRWLRPLAERLIAEGISCVTGLEYLRLGDGVLNEAVGVFAAGRHATAVCRWPKSRPARVEAIELAERKLKFLENQAAAATVINTNTGTIGTLICSELLDVRLRASLLGRIDLLLVPAWNQDTATFDHTIQTAANDLHCFIAVANNAHFSDCRVQTPSDKRFLRDAARLICRDEDEVLSTILDIDALRRFQLRSIAHPELDFDGFKPIPPGYVFRR